MNPSYGINFEGYKQLGSEKLLQRAKLIKENKSFSKKVSTILNEDAMEKHDFDSQEAHAKIVMGGMWGLKTKSLNVLKKNQKLPMNNLKFLKNILTAGTLTVE